MLLYFPSNKYSFLKKIFFLFSIIFKYIFHNLYFNIFNLLYSLFNIIFRGQSKMIVPLISLLLFTSISYSTSSTSSPQNSTSFDDDEACKMLDLCHQAPSLSHYQNCLMMQKTRIMVIKSSELNPPRNESTLTLAMPFTMDAFVAGKGMPFAHLTDHFSYLDCLNLECFCKGLDGKGFLSGWDENEQKCLIKKTNNGEPTGEIEELKMAHRKEIRMLSVEEREKFFQTLLKMKHDGIYDAIAASHETYRDMPGAHGGPGFALWHREYLKRMEFALRRADPDVVLPYWDSSLDSALPNPRDSIIWSGHFFGKMSEDGKQIMDGPFKDWKMPKENKNLERAVGIFEQSLINLDSIEKFVKINSDGMLAIPQCLGKFDFNTLEDMHDNVHIYVGGAMMKPTTAAGDPIFFLHHAFVDLIWEEWRQNQQIRQERESEYPTDERIIDCLKNPNNEETKAHFLNAEMTPFNYATMKTGLGNIYTDSFYNYSKRPHCTAEKDCGSVYLFCNREHGEIHVCVSRIRIGRDCSRFQDNDENPCFNSQCIDGKCVETPEVEPEENLLLSNKMTVVENQAKNKTRYCYDAHECCGIWSHFGGCHKESQHLNRWCPGSCGYDGCVLPEEHRNNEWEDRHPRCGPWVYHKKEECELNKHWMLTNCPKACGKCPHGHREKCQLELFNYCREQFPRTSQLDAWLDGLDCEKKKLKKKMK